MLASPPTELVAVSAGSPPALLKSQLFFPRLHGAEGVVKELEAHLVAVFSLAPAYRRPGPVAILRPCPGLPQSNELCNT